MFLFNRIKQFRHFRIQIYKKLLDEGFAQKTQIVGMGGMLGDEFGEEEFQLGWGLVGALDQGDLLGAENVGGLVGHG